MKINEITKKTEDVTDEKGYSLSNSNNTHAYDSDYCNCNHSEVSNEDKCTSEQVVDKSCKVKLVQKDVDDVEVVYRL